MSFRNQSADRGTLPSDPRSEWGLAFDRPSVWGIPVVFNIPPEPPLPPKPKPPPQPQPEPSSYLDFMQTPQYYLGLGIALIVTSGGVLLWLRERYNRDEAILRGGPPFQEIAVRPPVYLNGRLGRFMSRQVRADLNGSARERSVLRLERIRLRPDRATRADYLAEAIAPRQPRDGERRVRFNLQPELRPDSGFGLGFIPGQVPETD